MTCCCSLINWRILSIATMGYYDAQEGDADRTAFRKAEKRYKFYKHLSTSARSKHRDAVPPTDLSEVLDFHKIRSLGGTLDNGIRRVEGFPWPVFSLEQHPGFYFIPEALTLEEQVYWIKESLTNFPEPPNRTNHTAFHGHICGLWDRAQNADVMEDQKQHITVQSTSHGKDSAESMLSSPKEGNLDRLTLCNSNGARDNGLNSNNPAPGKTIPLKTLLYKLRWATVGLQFDWSKRAYDLSLPYRSIPPELAELASRLAKPAINGDEFHAEAAIVNYFHQDDMLGGHLDDMEADWSKPIVSISFGCKAIFLLGGTSREDKPTAMFLRSGDVVLMAGPARSCFHGVPRIFVDPKESDLPDFDNSDLSWTPFMEYITKSRINLNIRQVF